MPVDKSYRENLHRVVENYVATEVLESRNKKKSWHYGYHADFDMVVISKDGTIGQVVDINGLLIALPSEPKNIRFGRLRNKDQKWMRRDVPQELARFDALYSDADNIESALLEVFSKHKDWIDQDFDRIEQGDWFMNDGEAVYITGYNYFFLQHYKLTDMRRYADFRMPQRDYFLWVEACFADARCLGSLYVKNRRSFFSVSTGSTMICKAIRTFNGNFPIVSKTEDDAEKMFAKHFVKPLLELPKHLQPQRTGEVKPKKEIYFSAPKKKLTNNNKSNSTADGLDTIITYLASTIDAYDGWQVDISGNDEVGKLKNVDINEYWEQAHKECHALGSEVVGKALFGSTANPPNKGGRNYERFYQNSKIETRNITGQTTTGLYALFIKADLMQMGFYDEWGYAVVHNPSQPIKNELGKMISVGSKEFLDNKELACAGNEQKLNARKRNHPRVDTDPFLDEEATSMFGKPGLIATKNFLKEYSKTETYKETVFRFDLEWKDGIRDSTVLIKRHKNGRFMASWLPEPEFRNVVVERGKYKYPANAEMGAFGCDPYSSSRVRFGTGSKMGLVGITKDSPLLQENDRNKMFIRYNYRPDTIDEAEEDIIKLLVLTSMPILPEMNKNGLGKKLKARGYRKFVLDNPLKKKSELTPDELEFGGIHSGAWNIPQQESALENYIVSNLHEEIDEKDLKVMFIEALEEAEIYRPEDRQKRDQTVAWMYAALAVNEKVKPKQVTEVTITETNIVSMFENDYA